MCNKEAAFVKELIKVGQATHDDLFEAQYGQWPLSGMRKDIARDGVVHIRGMHRDRKSSLLSNVFSLGRADYNPDNNKSEIYLNKTLIHPAGRVFGILATRQAYIRLQDIAHISTIFSPLIIAEITASLALSSYRYAAISSLKKMISPSVADIVGEEQIHCLQLADIDDVSITDVFHNNAIDWQNNQPQLKQFANQGLQALDVILTLMPRAYYAQDAELQARLHNVLVRGYNAWGKLPENDVELYAALLDMGIKAPTSVKKFYHYNDDIRSITNEFRKHNAFNLGHINPPNAEINIGLNSYRDGNLRETGDVLDMYWNDALPFLYADLLQKYGDSKALERFGYSGERDITGVPLKIEPPKP